MIGVATIWFGFGLALMPIILALHKYGWDDPDQALDQFFADMSFDGFLRAFRIVHAGVAIAIFGFLLTFAWWR